jgi:hypothetical protein
VLGLQVQRFVEQHQVSLRPRSVSPFPAGFGGQSLLKPVIPHQSGFVPGLIGKLVRLNPAGRQTSSKPVQIRPNPSGTDPRLSPCGFFPEQKSKESETVPRPDPPPSPEKGEDGGSDTIAGEDGVAAQSVEPAAACFLLPFPLPRPTRGPKSNQAV